ncbi:MAG TPA: hypothetical protein VE861_09745, partial [Gemmatimonadaceae bacterium]|nr:hypothetical protein [Gemmatimonadaceae bacterium]
PLMPAAALLIARGLSLREAAPLGRPWAVALTTAAFGAAVIIAGTTTLATRALWWPHDALAWWWALLPIASAVMLLVWQRGRITRNAAVHSLAVSSAVLLCGLQLAAARAATVPYDTTPMASAVRAAVDEGRAIAMINVYNGEYHYAGRLQGTRIDVITADDAPAWLRAHARGLLLRYDRGRNAPIPSALVARHPFRNGWATLSATPPGTAVIRTAAAPD